jgi:signal peptidase II
VDQLTKLAVARLIPAGRIAWTAFGDFFWLVHQKNTGAAFSIGDSMPEFARVAILILMPLALLMGLCIYMLRTDELSGLQRWAVGGIIGGGLGNIIDRIFRPKGVIDFLSFKFYGLFGLERWPTFNVADSAVVVCGILLVVLHPVAGTSQPSSWPTGTLVGFALTGVLFFMLLGLWSILAGPFVRLQSASFVIVVALVVAVVAAVWLYRWGAETMRKHRN